MAEPCELGRAFFRNMAHFRRSPSTPARPEHSRHPTTWSNPAAMQGIAKNAGGADLARAPKSDIGVAGPLFAATGRALAFGCMGSNTPKH